VSPAIGVFLVQLRCASPGPGCRHRGRRFSGVLL